jgi:hypothetical protein
MAVCARRTSSDGGSVYSRMKNGQKVTNIDGRVRINFSAWFFADTAGE